MAEKKQRSLYKGKTFKLKYPFDFAGEVYEELTLRRPKAKDLKHLKAKSDGSFEIADMLELAANCAEESYAVIDNLDAVDAMALISEVSDFLADGPETTKTSSES